MQRIRSTRGAAALLAAALLVTGCSAGSVSRDDATSDQAVQLATQLQTALAAAGLPQPSTQVLTSLYGVDGGISCVNAGQLGQTDGLALFGNPSHSRRVPVDPRVIA